jgi:uncharacterized protein YbjT (DUF2867 family)
MKYSITGAAGHISKLLAELLLNSGHQVRIIGRDENHLKQLREMGAETAIGSVEDLNFLKAAFAGVTAVYTMCPPAIVPEGLTEYCEKVGKNYREAIEANHIRYVVNLSSVGAHLLEGAGHITGMNRIEEHLNSLENVSVKHLRPVYFYTNFFMQMDMISSLGIMGSNFAMEANKFPLVDPSDIAAAAGDELTQLNFTGHSARYIASDERGTEEIAGLIGKAIGNPGLKWIKFPDEQAFGGMTRAGIPEKMAKEFTEGFKAFHEGKITEDYWRHRPELGKVKLEEFANTFASVYLAQKGVAEHNN